MYNQDVEVESHPGASAPAELNNDKTPVYVFTLNYTAASTPNK
jgi:hypothetical protein